MPKRDNGHRNADAFMLMWYACTKRPDLKHGQLTPIRDLGCGHRERIWNSRDGVVPFGASCPSCGGLIQHVDWDMDVYFPRYEPHRGQHVWVDMDMAHATELAIRMQRMARARGFEPPDVAELAKSYYGDGDSPVLTCHISRFRNGPRAVTPEQLRQWADAPAANGYVPLHPDTLRWIADYMS